jgi:flagellar biosynthetic protein FliO
MGILGTPPRNRRTLVVISIAAGCFLLLSLVSASVLSKQPDTAETASGGSMAGMAARTIGAVAVVLGLLYAAMYGLRAFQRRGTKGLSSDAVAVLHRAPIAPKKAIYVIKVGSKAMVVGVTDAQISHLADLNEQEVASLRTDQPAKSFKDHLFSLGFGRTQK